MLAFLGARPHAHGDGGVQVGHLGHRAVVAVLATHLGRTEGQGTGELGRAALSDVDAAHGLYHGDDAGANASEGVLQLLADDARDAVALNLRVAVVHHAHAFLVAVLKGLEQVVKPRQVVAGQVETDIAVVEIVEVLVLLLHAHVPELLGQQLLGADHGQGCILRRLGGEDFRQRRKPQREVAGLHSVGRKHHAQQGQHGNDGEYEQRDFICFHYL